MTATTTIDLDQQAAPRLGRRRTLSMAVVLALLAVVAVVAGSMVAAANPPSTPVILVTAQWLPGSVRLPTVHVIYRDGSHDDATSRLGESWRPDRPVRLVTVVAEIGCSIDVDGRTVAEDRSERHRYAICTWIDGW